MTTGKFNPEMLLLARELRGVTQRGLSEGAGFSQAFVSQVEAGVKEASEDAAGRMAAVLRVPPSFFYQEERYTGFGLTMVYYRKKSGTLVSHLRRLQAEVNIRRIHVKRLLRGVDVAARHVFEFMDLDEHGGKPSDVAVRLRATWMLPIGPVRNLVSAIENAGGIVFKFPFGTTDIDAMSQWPDDTPPLFFLNASAPADRVRFSLAHELGHMVMHKTATESMEEEANEFASEFLMPRRDIGSQLIGLDLPRAAALKSHWRVSIASLVRRARDLGKITDARYKDLYIRLGQMGYRKCEPNPIATEEPVFVPRLFDVYLRENGMSLRQIGDLLCWPADEVAPRYIPATGIRLAQ